MPLGVPPGSYAYGDAKLGGGLGLGLAVDILWGKLLLERKGSLSPTSPQVVAATNGK